MRVAIVGAGASGLAAARKLGRSGHTVVVYEQCHDLGGRAATRRVHRCALDHGAQYLKTPPDLPEVRRLVLGELPREGLRDIARPVWTFDRVGHVEPGDPAQNAEPKWTYDAGLDTLGELLATGIEVRRDTRVARLERAAEGYRLVGDTGVCLGEAGRVLVAIPAPRAAALLRASIIEPVRRDGALAKLQQVGYQPMVTVLLGYALPREGTIFAGGTASDPRPYYALVNRDRGHDVSWLAIGNDKGPSRVPAGTLALVTQMAPPFSAAHYDEPDEWLVAHADAAVRVLLGVDLGAPRWHDVARWRYARPDGTCDLGALNRDHDGLFFAGDYVRGWRLHLALQAGLDVARMLAAP